MRAGFPFLLAASFLTRGIAADSGFVGPEACASCHPGQYAKQSESPHARALRPLEKSELLKAFRNTSDGEFAIAYDNSVQPVVVSINNGPRTVNAVLEWAFGAGVQGVTPVGRYGGGYFEHRYSYYSGPHRFAPTFGHPTQAKTAEAALGILQDGNTISRCFNCHATAVRLSSAGPDLSDMRAGVTCERCHGPGAAHVRAAKSNASPDAIRHTVVNPKRFAARAQVQMCGECHRLPTPDTGPEPEVEDPVSVRFAPVGLMASRCFREGKTLSCVTCHDPHSAARPRSAAFYSERCQTCHVGAKAKSHCPRAAGGNCVDCHMPEAKLGPYLRFTDHRIRVK